MEAHPGDRVGSGHQRRQPIAFDVEELALSDYGYVLPHELAGRLDEIRSRLIEARRELDALIGDAYLRPRASIVPVHFLDLASAVEKLRWAEKEWRELDRVRIESPVTDSKVLQSRRLQDPASSASGEGWDGEDRRENQARSVAAEAAPAQIISR
ncbi:MAG: hypothetical protein H0T12_02290 [Actinobacteria bacterium]|nr:hypothetical protein [Actinomycetota bacterium]